MSHSALQITPGDDPSRLRRRTATQAAQACDHLSLHIHRHMVMKEHREISKWSHIVVIGNEVVQPARLRLVLEKRLHCHWDSLNMEKSANAMIH